jgi:tRNA uridine 5-carbamoylmethylation protein Kti12
MKKKMYIMRGIPGSGKSTKAREITEKYHDLFFQPEFNVRVISTDNYWIRPDGEYDFNYKLLGKAHQWNQRQAFDSCEKGVRVVIIDNTNIQVKEMLSMARKFEYEVEIVPVHGTDLTEEQVREFAARNTHGVPEETVFRMFEKFKQDCALNELVRITEEYEGYDDL